MIRQGWYINLERSADRRRRMEAACARLEFPVERFPAYTPDSIPATIAARFVADATISPGARGCFASHLGVLEQVAAAPDGYYLVLEDDSDLHGDFASLGRDLADWSGGPEVIRLENPLKCPGILVRAGERYSYVRALHIPNSSAGYIATPAGARRLLDLAWEVDMPYDQFLRAVGRADVDMLVCLPPPLSPIDADTTIGASRLKRARRARGYRDDGFSAWREIRYVRRFGAIDFLRVLIARLRMRLAGIRIDRDQSYVLPPFFAGAGQ